MSAFASIWDIPRGRSARGSSGRGSSYPVPSGPKASFFVRSWLEGVRSAGALRSCAASKRQPIDRAREKKTRPNAIAIRMMGRSMGSDRGYSQNARFSMGYATGLGGCNSVLLFRFARLLRAKPLKVFRIFPHQRRQDRALEVFLRRDRLEANQRIIAAVRPTSRRHRDKQSGRTLGDRDAADDQIEPGNLNKTKCFPWSRLAKPMPLRDYNHQSSLHT